MATDYIPIPTGYHYLVVANAPGFFLPPPAAQPPDKQEMNRHFQQIDLQAVG
jgi:hypothetical protein